VPFGETTRIYVIVYIPGSPFSYFVQGFQETSTGQLQLVSTTPITLGSGTDATAVNVFGDPDGNYVFVGVDGVPSGQNTVTSEVIQSFLINNDGSLTDTGNDLTIPSVDFPAGEFGFTMATLVPESQYALVGLKSYGITTLFINGSNGSLTYEGYLAGDYPQNDMVVTDVFDPGKRSIVRSKKPGGFELPQYVYWSQGFVNGTDCALVGEDGTLTFLQYVLTGYGSHQVSLAYSQGNLFAIDEVTAQTVDPYTVNENTGSLIAGTPLGAIPSEASEDYGTNYYQGMCIPPDLNFLYCPNEADGSISQFSIGNPLGLTPLSPATVGG
jgi:hypothetical protein